MSEVIIKHFNKMRKHFAHFFTVYSTSKAVNVRNPLIAIIYLILLVLIWFSFLASLHLDVRKIYQKSCPVQGVVLTKVKGFVSTVNLTDEELSIPNPQLYRRTWDPSDLVYPAQGGEGEEGSFSIVTNLVITANQTLTTCADSLHSKCTQDKECTEGHWSILTNGVHTGRCLKSEGACEIRGWCPIQNGSLLPRNGRRALLEDVEDFTVLLKNTVEFPGCSNPQIWNAPTGVTRNYLRECKYDKDREPLCPIFSIGDIVRWSGDNFTQVAVKGGVFRLKVIWDCDLDFGRTVHDCKPKYEFLRVDDREAGIFSGFDFRSADLFSENSRTLKKQYALKIIIDLEGEGRKFDFFKLIIQVGATIGLFSVAALVCNFLLSMLSALGKFKGCGYLAKLCKTSDDDGEVDEGNTRTDLKLKSDRDGMEHIPQGYINDVFVKDRISTISNDSFQSLSEYK